MKSKSSSKEIFFKSVTANSSLAFVQQRTANKVANFSEKSNTESYVPRYFRTIPTSHVKLYLGIVGFKLLT